MAKRAPKRSGWACSASTISPPCGESLLIRLTRPPCPAEDMGKDQSGERGGVNLNLLPSPPWGRGRREAPGEGVTPERIGKEFPVCQPAGNAMVVMSARAGCVVSSRVCCTTTLTPGFSLAILPPLRYRLLLLPHSTLPIPIAELILPPSLRAARYDVTGAFLFQTPRTRATPVSPRPIRGLSWLLNGRRHKRRCRRHLRHPAETFLILSFQIPTSARGLSLRT